MCRRDGHRPACAHTGKWHRGCIMASARGSDRTLYRRLLHQVSPYWPYIAGIFVIDLCATPLSLFGPVPLKIVVDTIIGAQPLPSWLEALLPNSVTDSKLLLLSMATVL